ncbi:uncharacterized protein LOC119838284 [Zerene cesonia]|uniref:uncharacterized protein LOC119838284 n=1 Tax=Zerene cesonia TaxID=33412 RepID=UPI0018E532E9|nr:uncharacterized protein LOC119838284 [Zerene cesonia]
MPDKPKRRKNNKNKRRNKNQNQPNNNVQVVSTNESEKVDDSPPSPSQCDVSSKTSEIISNKYSEIADENITTNEPQKLLSSVLVSDTEAIKRSETDDLDQEKVDSAIKSEIKDEVISVTEKYKVESPEKTIKIKPKLQNNIKSKSVDNDDQPTIVEILDNGEKDETDNSLVVVDVNNVLIAEVDPDIEWENTGDLKDLKLLKQEDTVIPGALSVTTIPLNVAQCEQTKSMSPEEERCLRKYLQSLNLSSNQGVDPSCIEIKTEIEQIVEREIKQRLRKKGFAEDNFIPRLGPPRSLHVINEEVSGESSATSRRHSYLNENKSDTDELDDEVFNRSCDSKSKLRTNKDAKIITNLIPQQCIRVDAQIKDPEISEARGAWCTKQLESLTGAEIVYLTDSSSSTSSAYDINDIDEYNDESDVSVRIITPTIEVTDTDTFLKNNFRSKSEKSHQSTKVHEKDKNVVKEIKNEAQNDIMEGKRDNSTDGHEIVVLSTDVINTDLYVKEIDNNEQKEVSNPLIFMNQNHADNSDKNNDFNENDLPKSKKNVDQYDLEIKVLKCELNDAINNLIKEVISDSESVNDMANESLVRQDSSSSVGSSQCTAKYNPKCSSLNDIPGHESDEFSATNNEFKHLEDTESHVKDVIETIKENSFKDESKTFDIKTPSLRDLCLGTICKLPYGEQILEELANVSERLQKMSDLTLDANKFREATEKISNKKELYKKLSPKMPVTDSKIKTVPPPVQPRNSSLRITHDETQINCTKSVSNPSPINVCLSPSHKMLMEKTNTLSGKEKTEHMKSEHKISVDIREKDKDSKDIINVPFKSQTGSRLLALLRPSSINDSKENIAGNKGGSSNLSSFSNIYAKNENNTITKSNDENKKSFIYDHCNSFKPIPPPKPRKFSSSFYECNQSSNFIESSLKSVKNENKYFHYSTGNLSKEIEDDISSIQNMHRHYNDIYKEARDEFYPRRPSLPKDLCDQQMEYILRKEKEVEAEIHRLENDRLKPPPRRGPRAPMILDEETHDISGLNSNTRNAKYVYDNMVTSKSTPKIESGKLFSVFSKSEEELVRNKMYSEYVNQMAEREQRKQQKIIKITKPPHALNNNTYSKSESELKFFEHKVNNRIEKEFIDRAKERWNKLGFKDPETEDERDNDKNTYREPKVIEHKIKVIDSGEEKDVKKLPNHLQDFVNFTVKDKNDKSSSPETVMIAPTFKARSTSPAVWKPGVPPPPAGDSGASAGNPPPPPPPPVWTPNSASASPQTQRKTFRPVHFEESPPTRRKFEGRMNNTEQNRTAGSESESRLRTSQSAPATGLNLLGTSSRLPKAQNPTVTLLQKAREGQLPRAPTYQQQERDPRLPRDRPSPPSGDPVHALRRGYVSEGEGERRARDSERKMSDAQKKIDGIGPITKDGMPVALRSEVKDPSRWYKKMYDTIHKNKYDNDYVTIRYKSRRDEPQRVSSSRSQYAYFDPRSGYLSEPEGGVGRLAAGTWSDAYDSDAATAPRRRTASVQEERRNDLYVSNNKYSTLASTRASQEIHKAQPGKIENYTPGKSSVVDKEAKQWWDEVMDIFDGWLDENTPLPPYSTLLARAIQKNKSQNKTMDSKAVGTSSFGSPRKTMSPIQYNTYRSRYAGSSVVIEGGAGRKTPITNILDKVTPIDKLWGSQKRNERIDISKLRIKNAEKVKAASSRTVTNSKPTITTTKSPTPLGVIHKSRDMVRTSEKIQKLKFVNAYAQSTPCLVNKKDDRQSKVKIISNISKSSSNICSMIKKSPANTKSPSMNHLKNKKSLETITIKPKSANCGQLNKSKHYTPQKSVKETRKKDLTIYNDNEMYDRVTCSSQFGGDLCDIKKLENPKSISSKEIKNTHDAVMTNSFFQNLFCRNVNFPLVVDTNVKSNVKEKAQYFLSHSDYNTNALPSALNTYLIHRKPVSLSKFKMWDKTSSPIRSQSPRSISWPGRMDGTIRKFESLVNYSDQFGSTSSLSTVRSKSEPPANKLYFSQTCRPKSPIVIFHRKDNAEAPKIGHCTSLREATSPHSIIYTKPQRKAFYALNKNVNKGPAPSGEIIRPLSPHGNHFLRECLASETGDQDHSQPSTIFFSQTSRPVSPKVTKQSINKSRSHSTSPMPIRSPSYRRIHSTKTQHKSMLEPRPRSVDSSNKADILPPLKAKSKSDTIAHCNDPEYEEYMYDIQNAKKRSERFRELNRYYTYLERVGELEKSTSIHDLRHRKKDEEIIDFDRWKKIRAIERAEEELNNLYEKLKIAQNEKDFLFYPRDVKDFRWNCDKERGLKVKEKSVEDLKDDLLQKSFHDSHDSDQYLLKDVYKPLWRGTSVAETAFSINKKNNENEPIKRSSNGQRIKQSKELTIGDLRKKIGIGNSLWSSLSLDQVNALKDQLNAIYSKELESKSNKNFDKYTVEVKGERNNFNSNLHVRCNSLNSTHSPKIKEITKSESIAGICPISSDKEIKNNVNKMQMVLSENEKKMISQTLSKEVIKRINKEPTNQLINNEPKKNERNDESLIQITNNKDTNNTTLNKLVDHKRHVIYASEKEEPTQSSASETETGGSDISNTTVIYIAPKKEVQKKVEYFESVQNTPPKDSVLNSTENKASQTNKTLPEINKEQLPHSQSCTNIKELFGESEKNKFLSLPLKPDLHSRSPSPYSELYINDRRTPDTLCCSSDETIWRSRSPSPDPERYWRAYFKLARVGEVRRLARRFDSPSTVGGLRRHRSDPEITSNDFKNCLCTEKFGKQSEACKASLTVARVPLRSKNRFMPHIDIISKLAALRRRTTPRSRSAEEAFECRPGEVERIRKRFEVMSILGQIYNSAPDVSELKDIAPYLEGSWIAHQYPKPSDNNRSITDPKTYVEGRLSPIKKKIKKSVVKEPLKLNSILKSDTNEGQQFDPSVHRPISRYEPPRAPPRPPPAEWPYKLASFVTPRNTVTFKENDSAPEPPRRMQHSSISDSESPSRRYVESDVNIHYRCPVRHDPLPLVPERELARQQAEHMKQLYREQRRNKYLQENDYHDIDIQAFDASIKELQDMQSRRHQDNFMPSQKTVVPLNRYDETDRVIARALYTFNGQTSRELSFRKGDIIHVRRQIDNNWYEGEIHGRVGLFPYNYVELLKGDVAQSPKKPLILEGRARAKFDFTAQTNLELPLKKGELVVLTRRIDHNWWEGRIGNKTGIFPDSYVTILQEPSQSKPEPQPILSTAKPVASPAAHGLVNGDKRSLGAHSYTPQPNSPALGNAPPATQPLLGYPTKRPQSVTPGERGYSSGVDLNNTEPLYVDTNAEAIPYRAMYKYRPQNPDELELNEGDTVYVLEKCDDGWYVGSSQRTGRFGTFPGNYVERI